MISIEKYNNFLNKWFFEINKIREAADNLHDVECNQKYGDNHPYSYHLNMVGQFATQYAYLVCEDESHILPVIFGAYFHDAIEDARQTYNDILNKAKNFYMDTDQALMATEIVYALTDEKGRNRKERGSEKHYEDIRNTKYAPFVKYCDRLANFVYSCEYDTRMAKVYIEEMSDFIRKIGGDTYVPQQLINTLKKYGY